MKIINYPSHTYTSIRKAWDHYTQHFESNITFDGYSKWLWEEYNVKVPLEDDPVTQTYSVEFHDENLLILFLLRFL